MASTWTEETLESLSHYREEMYHRIYGKKRLMWQCPHYETCFVDSCYHLKEHSFDDDCEGGHECPRGIIPDPCIRIGGPNHKRITEGRCDSIWED